MRWETCRNSFNQLSKVCLCGKHDGWPDSDYGRDYIVGGKESSPKKHPWQVTSLCIGKGPVITHYPLIIQLIMSLNHTLPFLRLLKFSKRWNVEYITKEYNPSTQMLLQLYSHVKCIHSYIFKQTEQIYQEAIDFKPSLFQVSIEITNAKEHHCGGSLISKYLHTFKKTVSLEDVLARIQSYQKSFFHRVNHSNQILFLQKRANGKNFKTRQTQSN